VLVYTSGNVCFRNLLHWFIVFHVSILFGGTKSTRASVATRLHCPNENKRKVCLNGVDDGIWYYCRSHAIYRSSLVTSFRFTNPICVMLFQSSSIRWTAHGQSLKIRLEQRYWSFVSSLHLFEDGVCWLTENCLQPICSILRGKNPGPDLPTAL